MPQPADTTSPPLDRRCGQCGYMLRGLPEAGKCPECGTDFREDEIVLFGWEPGMGANLVTMRIGWPWVLKLFERWCMVAMALTILLTLFVRLTDWRMLLIGQVLLLPCLTLCAAQYRRYRTNGAPAPVQVRVGRFGVGTRVGLGGCRVYGWHATATIEFRKSGRDRWTLSIVNPCKGGRWMNAVVLEVEFDFPDAAVAWLQVELGQWKKHAADQDTGVPIL